jgi:predicted esterase
VTEAHSEVFVEVPIQGRYLIDANSSGEAKPLLLGFHGYGENAERHLQDLLEIPDLERYRIAAIQALHPFYNTKTGEVVASWMTKLNRESAIDQNIRYVRTVVESIRADHQTAPGLVFAGFSQGVAMAYRAATGTGFRCQGIIALAGDVPPELSDDQLAKLPPVIIGRGEEDQWYTREKMEADLNRLSACGVTVTPVVFDGGHEWAADFYKSCAKFLAGLNEKA